jgi:hypothetical protein
MVCAKIKIIQPNPVHVNPLEPPSILNLLVNPLVLQNRGGFIRPIGQRPLASLCVLDPASLDMMTSLKKHWVPEFSIFLVLSAPLSNVPVHLKKEQRQRSCAFVLW